MSLLKTNEIQNYNGSSLTLTASTVSTSAQLNTGGNISVTGSLNVSDDSTTRTNLGLGTISTQDSDSITVTGGTATLGALTVSGSDSGDLVRITQTGSGNALVVEDSANPDSTPFVVDSSGNVGIGSSPSNPFQVGSSNLIIDSSGNLLVGKASAGASSVGFEARASGYNAFTRDGGQPLEVRRLTSDGVLIDFRKDGSTVGTISTNANSLPSDRNFKKDIYELEFGLDLVKKLKPKTYRYKINDANSPFMIGFVAQDLEESLLEVGVNQNECWILQHNENVEDGNSAYQLDYSRLIPILAKAMQEQQTLIESQQSQIDALTARIEALETT